MARFHSIGELLPDNTSWFDVKLLTDCNNSQNHFSIIDQAYAKTMRSACKALGVMSKHFVHFGPGTGAVACEMQEVDPQYIKIFGNWNVDVREDRYSSKLPMKAMRVLAGHACMRKRKVLSFCRKVPSTHLQSCFIKSSHSLTRPWTRSLLMPARSQLLKLSLSFY